MSSENNPAGSTRLEAEAVAGILTRLAHWCDVHPDPAKVRHAAESASAASAGSGPRARLERLVAAAAGCGMRCDRVTLEVAEAAWQARPETPLAIVSPGPDDALRTLVVLQRGWARVSVDGIDPAGPVKMSTAALERLLGAKGARHEWLLVQAALPASPAGVSADAHGDGHVHGEGDHGRGHAHPSPFERIRALARIERHDLWTLFWYAVVTGLLYLAIPLAVDAMVGNIAFGGQQRVYLQALAVLAVALGAFLVLYACVRAVAFTVIERLQRRLFVRFTADLALRLPRVRQAEFDRNHGPELTNRFFDIMTLQKAAAQLLLDGLDVVLSFAVGSLMLAFYDWTLFWFDAGMLLLVALVIFGLGRGGVRTSIEESKSKYSTAGWLQQVALFSTLFKSPGGAELAARRADDYVREYLANRRRHFRILFRQVTGLLVIEVLASVALLVWGGLLVLGGKLSVGQLVASELILTATLAAVAKFGKQLETAYDLLTAIDKIGHLVDLSMERDSGSEPASGSPRGSEVVVDRVSFSYSSRKPVFRDMSVRIPAGARLALVAEASTGATTLLDLVFGLREPSGGGIEIDGLDLRQWHPARLREQVALVHGDDGIFDGTVMENVRLGNAAIGVPEVREALAVVGLLRKVGATRGGLDEPLALLGRSLSGSERRMILLARAIAQRPRLLLLDGTLDGLEAAEIDRIVAHIAGPERPWTLVVVTRDPDVIRHFPERLTLPGLPAHGGSGGSGHDSHGH